MKKVNNHHEFREYVLEKIALQNTAVQKHYHYYKNDFGDNYHYYFRKNCYEFGIGDYTIPHDFKLSFSNSTRLIRFGIVYTGTTTYKLENKEISSFSPSSFFVMEEHIAGKQAWKKGEHFHGAEVTIYGDYFNQVVEAITGKPFDFSEIEANHTYHYLSNEMTKALQQLQALALEGNLNTIYLESKIIEFIGILYNEIYHKKGTTFYNQSERVKVTVGSRTISLSHSDLASIRDAHNILTKQYISPPTIEALSKMVFLNSQKLKAGFLHQYHMTIGTYITTLRMSAATVQLCTTNENVHQIAEAVGYSKPSNFIRMFKQYYGETPLEYRKRDHSSG